MTPNSQSDSPTLFHLDEYTIPVLTQIATDHPIFYIDGICFDMGVGMTLSCRGVSPNSLTVHLRPPTDTEKAESTCYTKYLSPDGKVHPFPVGLKVWVHRDVDDDFAEDEDLSSLGFVFLNPDFTPPLFHAEMQ